MTTLASDIPAPASHRPGPGARLALDAWGVVFCGGRSRRMGRDKALLVLDGTTLIARAVATLGGVVPRVVLASGERERYPELGLECVLDGEAGSGPLWGLSAALARLEREGIAYACVLACDMPRVAPAVFAGLLARARASDADACLLASEAGLEPLCGVVHVRCRRAVAAALARGERRMNAFHGAVRLVTVRSRELGLSDECADNLNTPEEYLEHGGRLS